MNLKLTPQGLDLLLNTIGGIKALNFNSIVLGSGTDAGESATNLSSVKNTVNITDISAGNQFVTLSAVFSNSEISDGFRQTEIGILADDPDNEGSTILYAYGYTEPDKADYIPKSDEQILETNFSILVYVGDAENVTATISASLVYATRDAFEEHCADENNPHNVTCNLIGAVPTIRKINNKTLLADVVLYGTDILMSEENGAVSLKEAIDNKSPSVHNHNTSYYTKNEIETKLSDKANSVHNHDGRYYKQEEMDSYLTNLKFFHAGNVAPANTKLLWIDTNPSTGGLKYHNGNDWVTVPVCYAT